MFKLGEIKIPCDEDINYIKNLCLNDNGWHLEHTKKNIKVLVKENELSSFKMIKVKVEFDDLPARLLYDVFMDGEYRTIWDDFMVEGYDYCYLTPNSDVGYYCAKSPKPVRNRDFVVQRSWLDNGAEKVIFSHTINHAKIPPVKNRVRGLTYLTACYITSTGSKSSTLYYVTQTDPGGSLPSWVVNMTTKVFTPKFIKKVHKACLKYDKWKAKHNPEYRPWENPEVLRIPKLDMNDVIKFDVNTLRAIEDESQIAETEVDQTDLND